MSDDLKPKADSTKPKRRGYSVQHTSVVTDLSRSSIYRLIAAGRLKTVKVGARRIILDTSIDALLDVTKPDAFGADEQGSISKVPPQRAARLAHTEAPAK
jgi:predicted DNA-binding transcriptional regulator AlpA